MQVDKAEKSIPGNGTCAHKGIKAQESIAGCWYSGNSGSQAWQGVRSTQEALKLYFYLGPTPRLCSDWLEEDPGTGIFLSPGDANVTPVLQSSGLEGDMEE